MGFLRVHAEEDVNPSDDDDPAYRGNRLGWIAHHDGRRLLCIGRADKDDTYQFVDFEEYMAAPDGDYTEKTVTRLVEYSTPGERMNRYRGYSEQLDVLEFAVAQVEFTQP